MRVVRLAPQPSRPTPKAVARLRPLTPGNVADITVAPMVVILVSNRGKCG